ncbi:hypothetical protein PCE1_000657 [Barthelona sp. PCE]
MFAKGFLLLVCLIFISVNAESCRESSHIECTLEGGAALSNCQLGNTTVAHCSVDLSFDCTGDRSWTTDFVCKPCYLLPTEDKVCSTANDKTCSVDRINEVVVSCTAKTGVVCVAPDVAIEPYSWTEKHQCIYNQHVSHISMAFLSVLGGGFGFDRFGLSMIFTGIVKLVTLGFLGVGSIIDAILVIFGYLSPVEGIYV